MTRFLFAPAFWVLGRLSFLAGFSLAAFLFVLPTGLALTSREAEVLLWISRGKSNREIGEKLDLREATVKHYMTNILQKLHVRNRVEAALLVRDAARR